MDLKTASLIVSKYASKPTKADYPTESIYCRVVDANGTMHLVATDGWRLVICLVESPQTTGLSEGESFLLPPTKKGYVAFRKGPEGKITGEDAQGAVWAPAEGLSRYPAYRNVIPVGSDLSRTPPDGLTLRPEFVLDAWEDLRKPYGKKTREVMVCPAHYTGKGQAIWVSAEKDYFHLVAPMDCRKMEIASPSFRWTLD